MLAGVAGALFILYKGYIGPTTMSAFAGAGVLMMVLLGGMGTLWGPLVGAAIFIYIQDYISTMTEHWEIYLGIVVVVLVSIIRSISSRRILACSAGYSSSQTGSSAPRASRRTSSPARTPPGFPVQYTIQRG